MNRDPAGAPVSTSEHMATPVCRLICYSQALSGHNQDAVLRVHCAAARLSRGDDTAHPRRSPLPHQRGTGSVDDWPQYTISPAAACRSPGQNADRGTPR